MINQELNQLSATSSAELAERWTILKNENPGLRIRNAAEMLGVTEMDLICLSRGSNVTQLQPQFKEILLKIESLGKVMALSRNNQVVHERKGVYLNPGLNNPHVGLFVGEDIDLRIFFESWGFAFAVIEGEDDKPRKSLQFFAKNGQAIHKIYLTSSSNAEAFDQIVSEFAIENQDEFYTLRDTTAPESELPDSDIDVLAFQNEWKSLLDSHDFYPLLKKYQLTRTQALRLAPSAFYANQKDNGILRRILNKVSEAGIEIMVFVGNQGIIQIHTGPAKKIVDFGEWLNVLDPDFNLHVKEPDIHSSWIVRKPTKDGIVTALECFNKEGEQIIQLFGKRKPGLPELESWRDIILSEDSI